MPKEKGVGLVAFGVGVLSADCPKLNAGFEVSFVAFAFEEGAPKENAGDFDASGAGVLDFAKEEAKKLGIGF